MKTLNRIGRVLALSAALGVGTLRGGAQGTILFDTLVPAIVDARWWLSKGDDFPFAQGWIAQLMVGPVPADPLLPLGANMQPVFPTTTFRPSDDPERGYVNPVVVTVPHLPPGAQAVVYMIAYPDVEPRPPPSARGWGHIRSSLSVVAICRPLSWREWMG